MRIPRIFRASPAPSASSVSVAGPYKYSPLEDDCIRIVYLHPRKKKRGADEVECTLTHVAFADRPEYNALSYAWGDGTVKRPIILDGIAIEANENLAAALINMRGLESAGEKPIALWIDAICINQEDIEERGRQVRLMPLIYSRAQTVLVWLGSALSFDKFRSWENDKRTSTIPKHASPPVHFPPANPRPGAAINMAETYKMEDLCKRPYWKRLWIIQEIGKARPGGLRIHYDFTSITWDRFIAIIGDEASVKARFFEGSIPLRLHRQREDRYRGGHSLSNLLRAHQSALCKDPRDKIYGLIGLAVDVQIHGRFPIDYSKSLFEIFTDTVFFLNGDPNRDQSDILDMSRFIGRTLGGPQGVEPDFQCPNFDAGIIGKESQVKCLRVPARLVGRIQEIGPIYSDVVARPQRLDDWQALICRNISDLQLRSIALQQSETFLQLLWNFDEISQRTIFAFDRTIQWEESQQYSLEAFERSYGQTGNIIPVQTFENYCRLFLLQLGDLDGLPTWIGLSPIGAQAGDFICQIAGMERAVVLRQLSPIGPITGASGQNYTYKLIGCAGLARDTLTSTDLVKGGIKLLPREFFSPGPSGSPTAVEHYVNLYMDIHTAWEISVSC